MQIILCMLLHKKLNPRHWEHQVPQWTSTAKYRHRIEDSSTEEVWCRHCHNLHVLIGHAWKCYFTVKTEREVVVLAGSHRLFLTFAFYCWIKVMSMLISRTLKMWIDCNDQSVSFGLSNIPKRKSFCCERTPEFCFLHCQPEVNRW